ncbi:MAG: DUF615 domain-containing protein, partial [Desulfatitalea sp.]|nr:DUF615 domain-containing protein [Desulfatitalea sp.]
AALNAQTVGEQLLRLSDDQLAMLGIEPELRRAVNEARRMHTHGARRRQLQYIGALMRQVDVEQLQDSLAQVTQQADMETQRFRRIERWRDQLLSGDEDLLEKLAGFPQMDRKTLHRLVFDARRPASGPDARKAGRALFRFLRKSIS